MKLKSFCTTKDMASKLERSPTEWEKTCTSYIRQETDNQNIRKLKKLNSQKINNPMKKWANELNRAFSKEEVQMAKKKHMKIFSPFLAIKEMQIKTTLRFHLTLVRMTTIKNTSNNKC
jgi:hypothetical protein